MADYMVDAADTALDKAPEAFDGVGMSITADVDLSGVVDAFVPVSNTLQAAITPHLVGEHCRARHNLTLNERYERCGTDIRRDFGDYLPLAPYNSHDDRLTARSATPLPAPLRNMAIPIFSSDISLVNLDLAAQRLNVFIHEFPNLFEHAPSGLIGDSNLPLQLLGGDSRPCRCHHEDGVEPRFQGCSRLVEDSASGRRDMSRAEVARIDFAVGNTMVLCDPLALSAEHAVGPASVLDEI